MYLVIFCRISLGLHLLLLRLEGVTPVCQQQCVDHIVEFCLRNVRQEHVTCTQSKYLRLPPCLSFVITAVGQQYVVCMCAEGVCRTHTHTHRGGGDIIPVHGELGSVFTRYTTRRNQNHKQQYKDDFYATEKQRCSRPHPLRTKRF